MDQTIPTSETAAAPQAAAEKLALKPIFNIAIIAHVDHGKTTLVDAMLRQSGTFRANEAVAERVMDSNDLERERGITILAKNTALYYHDNKINIVDTPGHADFGGEVERTLKMVDGVVLLVDASEGPLPQTRFVLSKALEAKLTPIVVINKIDRPDARPQEVLNEVFDLFIDLGADEDMLDFPVLYTTGKVGTATTRPRRSRAPTCSRCSSRSSRPSPPPRATPKARCRCWSPSSTTATTSAGWPSAASSTAPCAPARSTTSPSIDGTFSKHKITKLFSFSGLKRTDIDETQAGDIVAIAGIPGITIGESFCDVENPQPLPPIKIDEPTIAMEFIVNNSPFAGREGKLVTSRNLRERLDNELLTNVSLKMQDTGSPDTSRCWAAANCSSRS